MKRIILIAAICGITMQVAAQVLAPKGIKVGPDKDATIAVLTKIKTLGTNKVGLYSGNNLLTVVSPDTVAAKGTVVLYADSNYRKSGSYVPMYDYRTKPTDRDILKAYKARGSAIKMLPISMSGFSSQYTMTDGEALFALCYLRDTATLTSFKYMLSQISSGATFDNTNAFAVYSLSGSTATKIAETPNTTAIWTQTAFTVGSVNLSTPVVLPPGFYYLSVLFNTSVLGTAPKIYVSDQGLITFLSQTNVGVAGSKVFASFPASFDISTFSNQQYVAGIFGF